MSCWKFLSLLLVFGSSDALECDLYIAESTIPNAGLGVFSTVEKKVGDNVGNGDVCFPLIELDWHNGYVFDSNPYFNPFEDYVWDGKTMGMGKECDEVVTALWPGLDCAINCNIPLENVKRSFPKHPSHGTPLNLPHRSKDPGAGAITPYRSAKTTVTRHVPAGGELFKFYGDQWFLTRADEFAGFDALPLKNDFPAAQALIEKYFHSFDYEPVYDLILDIRDTWKTARTLNAVPSSVDEAKKAASSDVTHLHQPNATRSREWLEEHGKCMDHIIPGPSTIPGAGEGAFAKRNLPNGTVITGSPILVIPNENFLDMYDFEEDEETEKYTKSPLTKQVLFNYCLGHKDSTILLFPYGSGVHYLNHGDSSKVNVRMEWAEHGSTGMNEAWLEMPPEEMENVFATNLAIDYIATRDIAEGEELFIDYGIEWERAWHTHVEHWEPPDEDECAVDFNIDMRNEPIRTSEEEEEDPYPPTVELRCHVDLLVSNWRDQNPTWDRYDYSGEEYQYVYGVPCTVWDRSPDGTYEVELFIDRLTYVDVEDDFWDNPKRSGVPREAMFFVDAEYQGDLFLTNGFRHHIGIPRHMMPDAWRNKNSSKASPQEMRDEL